GEDLVYLGDTRRYPYGPRPQQEVRAFARQIARRLVEDHDVKLVVVACNSASAAALDTLHAELPVPVVGVIEPGGRSLIAATRRRSTCSPGCATARLPTTRRGPGGIGSSPRAR